MPSPDTHPRTGPTDHNHNQPIRITRGEAQVIFAFDVGMGIDLANAERALGQAVRVGLALDRGAPSHLQFRPRPLRVERQTAQRTVAGIQTLPQAHCTLYDFGAASVAFHLPVQGTLDDLAMVARALQEHAQLAADAAEHIRDIVRQLGAVIDRPELAPANEDYVIFHAMAWSCPDTLHASIDRACRSAAAVLRAEDGVLAEQEVADALSCRIAYSDRDATLIDWSTALVFDDRGDDTIAVLEFANVELMELRTLDDRLDAILDRAYLASQQRRGTLRRLFGRRADERRRLAALQMDAALLFEGISNAIKLVGDQFLARLYRLTAQRLHVAEWETSIQRKLQSVEGIYEKLTDESASRRMEVLEWIVILLIAISIIMPFFVSYK